MNHSQKSLGNRQKASFARMLQKAQFILRHSLEFFLIVNYLEVASE